MPDTLSEISTWLADLASRGFALIGGEVWQSVLVMTAPVYLLAVLVILLLERWKPAQPNPPFLSAAYAQDLLWALIQSASNMLIIVTWAALVKGFYDKHLAFLTLDFTEALPTWALLLLTVLILDFLQWLQHVIQHKVPWFWEFHAVHHSQQRLNLFTDYRYHVFEYVVRKTVFLFPMLILGLDYPAIVWLSFLTAWQARLYHANIRSDFGPLRWILVTPQSHRIHHSIEARHRDRNYGGIFCIWDRMFGTHVDEWDQYPATGIHDKNFPLEQSARPDQLLWTLLRQTLYPFMSIWRRLKAGADSRRIPA